MNLYEVLELDTSASLIDIKRNYRRLAKVYHPDRNKDPECAKKFQQISSAYEILSDDKSRKEYLMLNTDKRSVFQEFLSNILNNSVTAQNLEHFGIKLTSSDSKYLESHFYDMINSLNLTEIINFFKSGQFPKKDFEMNNVCSDTDVTSWDSDDCLYIYKLPIELQKHNSMTLRICIDIKLEDIINNKENKITLKRKINDNFINTTFSFNTNSPWVVFGGGGDTESDLIGDLIIKLNLPDNYDWMDNMIIYNHSISLYEYVYGTSISFQIGNKKIEYKDWVVAREGNIIFINLDEFSLNNINFAIKFTLNYVDEINKKEILKQLFN